jgi:hypothetical protein
VAYETERTNLEAVVDKHASVPVIPEFSAPVASRIVSRCRTLNISPPLVIQRFEDRAKEPTGNHGVQDKISRDFYQRGFEDLPADKQKEVQNLHSAMFNPATPHPYFKAGLNFAQGRHLLLETYRLEASNKLPQDLRVALVDFRDGLERDLDDSARIHGFFKEYGNAIMALKTAVSPHRESQAFPMATGRR